MLKSAVLLTADALSSCVDMASDTEIGIVELFPSFQVGVKEGVFIVSSSPHGS